MMTRYFTHWLALSLWITEFLWRVVWASRQERGDKSLLSCGSTALPLPWSGLEWRGKEPQESPTKSWNLAKEHKSQHAGSEQVALKSRVFHLAHPYRHLALLGESLKYLVHTFSFSDSGSTCNNDWSVVPGTSNPAISAEAFRAWR